MASAQNRSRSRRRAGAHDKGSAWISYSDMMAALLLVFVLVLCYSIYQYYVMLSQKTSELDAQQAQLVLSQAQLAEKQKEIDAHQLVLQDKEDALADAHNALTEKETELGLIASSLSDKEDELRAAQAQLADQQNKLDAFSLQLTEQANLLTSQHQQLQELLGIRPEIIRALNVAFANANVQAQVDAQTGNIQLKSSVFFDTGSNTIKQEGRAFLDSFVPLYLSILLQDEYRDYLSEIIIEGHTDSTGSYDTNLKLSLDRAYAVAQYCLDLPGLTNAQRTLLRQIITPTGKSYSNLVMVDGVEDKDASRRVEFKFALRDTEMIDQMEKILSDME